MSRFELDRWSAVMNKMSLGKVATSFSKPIPVILQEALSVAAFCSRRWTAARHADGSVARPGLELALYPSRSVLSDETADEIVTLLGAINQAQFMLESRLDDPTAPSPHGHEILREMRAFFAWIADVEPGLQPQLETLASRHDYQPSSNGALALALEAYALFGSKAMTVLAKAPGFDVKLIDRARVVVQQLRARGSTNGSLSDAALAALDLRNRLLHLLIERVQVVRAAARLVFRKHPEWLHEAASTYDRNRRGAGANKHGKKSGALELVATEHVEEETSEPRSKA